VCTPIDGEKMLLIHVTTAQGASHDVQAREGQTLLEAVQTAGVDGLLGECGGCCSCATCHCVIDEAQLALLTAPDSSETQMLDFVATERLPGSRLACQIKLQAQHQGLRLTLPERQF